MVASPTIRGPGSAPSYFAWPVVQEQVNAAPGAGPFVFGADEFQRARAARSAHPQHRHVGTLGGPPWARIAPASWPLPRQDVSTSDVNPNHPGNGQSARLGVGPGGRTPIHLRSTQVYDGMGNPMGHTSGMTFGPGHSGGINAGQITNLRLTPGGKPEPCVFAWKVHTDHGLTSGWVPLSAISPRAQVEQAQRAIASRIDRKLGPDRGPRRTYFVVPKSSTQAGVDGLYVFRHEHSPVENKAKYFFSNGGMSGVMLNVPRRGDDGRFGIAADIVPKNVRFTVDRSIPAQKVNLYALGQDRPSGKSIKFVYGYFVNDAGEKRHGWINAALLSRRPAH